ncbi:MAG TPA: hypothetical protein VM662_02090 [Sphingomonas sp.]|nr:hypothetical protein [Sphingomonas sp.]
MAKVILRYPDGSQGVALLLLRLSLAVIAFPSLARSWPASANWWPVAIPAAALGLALAAGFGTRAAALLLTATLVAGLVSAEAALAPFLAASSGSAASLALLGPGHIRSTRIVSGAGSSGSTPHPRNGGAGDNCLRDSAAANPVKGSRVSSRNSREVHHERGIAVERRWACAVGCRDRRRP